MNVILAMVVCVLAAVPPLTQAQREALAAAQDGRDEKDAAFAALLENAAKWTAGAGDEPVRLEPDVDTMLADPARYRGDMCRIVGAIQQQTRLAAPYERVTEWFVRDASGRPLLVYVYGVADTDEPGGFRDGQPVEIYARFWKRVEAEARDGLKRPYPAFVGALPKRPDAPSDILPTIGRVPLAWVAIPVALLLIMFVIVLLMVRRSRSPARVAAAHADRPAMQVDEGPALPDDPAAALDELRRRAETGGP